MARTTTKRWQLATVGVMSSAAVYSGLVYELEHTVTAQNQQLHRANSVVSQRKALTAEIAQRRQVLTQLEKTISQVQTHTKEVQAKLKTVQHEITNLKSGLTVSVQSVGSVQSLSPTVSIPSSSSPPPVQSVTRASAP
ncbi:hypothetical protein [Alicyclobacillus sp. ALC3]|uniref:hypothetical protein n=1 Tax=Alicyclobacillus sp. ALC3 TaxID=2796143 RepID=UPI0023794443|nr:hypothetical protein [Alicyclobacillus sp. ALC3]WDL97247.1 hypothetical protein JC200_00325 [Alicyclobacillus sp. ALC3]